MSRVKRGCTAKRRKDKILAQSKGFRGRSKNCIRLARRRLEKSWQYAYRDRKVRKRDFRSLWIIRLNASLREMGFKYSTFINKLSASDIGLNRKVLADMASENKDLFVQVVNKVMSS